MNFLYTGKFDDEHTNCFIELNNHQYNSADEYKKLQRKSGFLIAECFQNIVRHNEVSNRDSYFHIRNHLGLLSIVSANTVQNDIIPTLEAQLNGLNQLTNDELKEAYRKVLTDDQYSEKGGAGLGMIEMARRTKNKLNFTFTDIDEENSYFYFKLHLNLKDTVPPIDSDFDESILLRNRMLQDKLFFIYNGVISIQTTIIILEIIEKSLESIKQKVLFVKFMGFFEKLTAQIPPSLESNSSLLIIGEDEKEYKIAVSCLMEENKAMQLDRSLKLYAAMEQSALDNEYKRMLADRKHNSLDQNNIELIELLKNSSQLEVQSQSYQEDVSLLTMTLSFTKKKRPQFIDHTSSGKTASKAQKVSE